VRREQERREQEHRVRPDSGAAAPLPTKTPVGAILALQRGAGNQAVGRILARDPVAEASRISQLDEELDAFNTDEENVIGLLRALTDPEKAQVLSGGYRSKVAKALDVEEMVRAVKYLGPLHVKLEWVAAAGSPDYGDIRGLITDPAVPQSERDVLATSPWRDWFMDVCTNKTMQQAVVDLGFRLPNQLSFLGEEMCADYSDIKWLITAATVSDADRQALKTTTWRNYFVGVCTNDTMLEAVRDLKFDLGTKLDWMAEEGTDETALGEVIRVTPQPELDVVAASTTLMTSLRERLDGDEYTLVERMVKQGMLGVQYVTNTADVGAEFKSVLTMWRSGIVMSKDVQFIEEGTFPPGGFEALIARCKAAVDTWLSRKYKLRISSPSGPQEGDGEYPIIVVLNSVPSSRHDVTLFGGQTGRSSMTDTNGKLYADGQAGDNGIMDVTLAHEFGHLILGASDEYEDAEVEGRVATTDDSLMGHYRNQGPWPTPSGAATPKTEIKARNFEFLVKEVAEWFPGRTISIIK
jgi:hypothetical protein